LSESLSAAFALLDVLRQRVPGISGNFNCPFEEAETNFNDIDGLDGDPPGTAEPTIQEPAEAQVIQDLAASVEDKIEPIQSRMVPIPSTSDNANPAHSSTELSLRKRQATCLLGSLRELIADKSFQYSHVIRVAPQKSVRTRARAALISINSRIAHCCRVYARCRSAMTRLGADAATLVKFKVLTREDIKCSTALLDPNRPGSTRIQLSWIWETGSGHDGASAHAVQECVYLADPVAPTC